MTQMGAWSATDQSVACNNKLLAHKSSFQAWKCVSFGCSLLAAVLLLSKCYEVSTDLNLLLGIEQLITRQDTHKSSPVAEKEAPLSWPPVPIEVMLPAQNESGFGMESMRDNSSMLMSHMHLSLGRELASDNLLRQEVEAFVGEFKMAKSTLSLSVMLVGVYIISWILMTLAINDTRISNDVSLRNILLLSVFGAIDVAASVGFVMVRLIMYSVKNHSFASKMVATTGLKDTPTRLSADQLTAFTALRLIGMRSCSAYVDIYVSVVMALLTVLRLYAITRALGYYRRLRRITDPANDLDFHQQASDLKQQNAIWSSSYYNAQPVSGMFTAAAAATHQLISPVARRLSQSNLQQQVDSGIDRSFRMMPDPYNNTNGEQTHGSKQYYHGTLPLNYELNPRGSYRFQTNSVPPPQQQQHQTQTSKLVFSDDVNNNQTSDEQIMMKPPRKRASIKQQQQQQSKTTNRSESLVHHHQSNSTKSSCDAAPNLLLVSEPQSIGSENASSPRLFHAASLSRLNNNFGETAAPESAGKVRSYTLMRQDASKTKDHRYRLVEVARFKAPRRSLQTGCKVSAAGKGSAGSSGSASSSESSRSSSSGSVRRKPPRQARSEHLSQAAETRNEEQPQVELLYLQQLKQQQLSMSPKQIVEAPSRRSSSHLINKNGEQQRAAPLANSFLLSKYYYA